MPVYSKLINPLLFLVFVLKSLLSFGQAGTVDMSFNPNDKGFGQGDGFKRDVGASALLPDGKILVLGGDYNGQAVNNLARLTTDGTLDSTFRVDTKLQFDATTFALQTDGKILIGGQLISPYFGQKTTYLARLNVDGTLDNTFNMGSGPSGPVSSIALQADGKILIGGNFTQFDGQKANFLVRLNPDGTLDKSFISAGTNGQVLSITVQSDEKILLGGDFTNCNGENVNYLARLNADGSLDYFNLDVGPSNSVSNLALQADGKILIVGTFTSYDGQTVNRLARLNIDGTLDNSFNNGVGANGSIYSIVNQSDGKILIGGAFKTYDGQTANRLARLNKDGSIDTTFKTGSGPNSYIRTINIQSDGKLLIGGAFTSYNGQTANHFARLNIDETLDNSFNIGTGANNWVRTTVLQPDGKILIGGDFRRYNGQEVTFLARLDTDGTLDTTFKKGSGLNGPVDAITVQPDGKILIAGGFSRYDGQIAIYFTRLNKDGTFDTTFKTGNGTNGPVYSMTIQADGKIIIGGYFEIIHGQYVDNLARLNSDGTLDTSFKTTNGANDVVRSCTLQADGNILIGGDFTSYGGQSVNKIARLKTDGSLDANFTVGSGANDRVNSIAVQTNGKILIGGYFNSYNGQSISRIARLNTDGTLDASFKIGIGADDDVYSIALQADGKILIVGDFTSFNGQTANRIARLNADGSFDSNFKMGTGANNTVYSIALQADGNILIGGSFTSYNGIGRNRIARLIGDSYGNNCIFKTSFENIKEIDCQTNTGTATAKAYFGQKPFSYNWLNASISNDSIATFNQSGLYTCAITDANGCSDTASLWISGSKYPSGFDLNTALVNQTPFRTGFPVKLNLNAINTGCVNTSGQLKLVLDSLVTFESAEPTPDYVSGDTLIWNFSDLYYSSAAFSPQVVLKTKTFAGIGDTIHLKTIVTPIIADVDTTNNIREYYYRVINSYDPNDISVNPQGICPEGYIKNDQSLTYTVRFQNTGNAEAVNIAVADTLSGNLDASTLRVLSSSDTLYTLIEGGNVVKFMFDSIMLPDSMHNEPASHGYVVFEIQPKAGLADGTKIKNKVGIYFDFNPAVLTNTVTNTISDNPTEMACKSISTVKVTPNKSQLYPNPSEGLFTVSSSTSPKNINVFDQTGKLILSVLPTGTQTHLDLSKFTNGFYFIQVSTPTGIETLKAVLSK